jgi:hypothetical protein
MIQEFDNPKKKRLSITSEHPKNGKELKTFPLEIYIPSKRSK